MLRNKQTNYVSMRTEGIISVSLYFTIVFYMMENNSEVAFQKLRKVTKKVPLFFYFVKLLNILRFTHILQHAC